MVVHLRDPHLTPFMQFVSIRRIRDFAEAKGTQFSLALLDWEKAFDKAQHGGVIFALKKLGSVNTIVISLKVGTRNLLFS